MEAATKEQIVCELGAQIFYKSLLSFYWTHPLAEAHCRGIEFTSFKQKKKKTQNQNLSINTLFTISIFTSMVQLGLIKWFIQTSTGTMIPPELKNKNMDWRRQTFNLFIINLSIDTLPVACNPSTTDVFGNTGCATIIVPAIRCTDKFSGS